MEIRNPFDYVTVIDMHAILMRFNKH